MVKDKEEVKQVVTNIPQTSAEMVEVPTATAIAFKLESGEVVNEHGLLLEIYKSVKKIEKSVA